LAKLSEELKNQEFVLLKVATKEKEKDVIKYKKEHNFSSPILVEDDAAVSNAYGVWSRPQTFLSIVRGRSSPELLRNLIGHRRT
jgi:peroxiredoxin